MAGVVGWRSSSNNRSRAYGMMLLLAFGAAVFGVLILHKLRERRLLNILIKDKDRDILALQLLLRKERDASKELRIKFEEMKVTAVTLRNQKAELTNRLVQMQSITVSLREEIKSLDAALEEKENKIKVLEDREKNKPKEDIQALKDALTQKEAEIEELKQRLAKQFKVLSVRPDYPSQALVNLTAGKEEGGPSQDGQVRKPMEYQNGEGSTKAVDVGDDKNEEHRDQERHSVDNGVLNRKIENSGKHVKVEESERDAAEEGLNFVRLNNTKSEKVKISSNDGESPVKVDGGKEEEFSGAAQMQKQEKHQNEEESANPEQRSSKYSQNGVDSMTRDKGDQKKKSKRRRVISIGNELKLSVNPNLSMGNEGRYHSGLGSERKKASTGSIDLEKLENPPSTDTVGKGEKLDGKKTIAAFVKEKELDTTGTSQYERSSESAKNSDKNPVGANGLVLGSNSGKSREGNNVTMRDEELTDLPRSSLSEVHDLQRVKQKKKNHLISI
ncbi:uncharacterized protein [Aristolochia californica]|uniref:uncharacterized protein n=1 Tax=Aristolochia californica TaxID=171875 RepID=UPI0035DF1C80